MRLFISYSTGDLEIVNQIADALRPHAEVYYWAKDNVPGQDAWQTIFQWIFLSDLVVAVITDKTVSRAMSVGQEIGHAKALNKTIIPLVHEEVSSSELGCLHGVTYISFSGDNATEPLNRLKGIITRTKQEKEAARNMFLTIGGILVLLYLFFGDKDDKKDWF